MASRVSRYVRDSWNLLLKDATQKGIHLVSNRFISPEREAEYQKYGELHIRPRAMLFCAVAGLAHATYTVIRWFGSSGLAHTDLQTIRTIRVICTFIPLILLPCMHFFPTKWKECTTMFIAMNAITAIIYYFQKRELAVYSNVNDVSLFYQNWNLTDTTINSLSAVEISQYTSKPFQSSLKLDPKLSSIVLVNAFVSRVFDMNDNFLPTYALLSGMICGIGVLWATLAAVLCEILYIVLLCFSYSITNAAEIPVGDLLIEISIFLVLCFVAHKWDQNQRITVSTITEASRRTNALRSVMIRHISMSSFRDFKLDHDDDKAFRANHSGKRSSEVAVKVQSKLERVIRKISDLSDIVQNESERSALQQIATDLSKADVQAYQPDLERELALVSDDNLVKKWLLELDPNRNRRSNLNDQAKRDSYESDRTSNDSGMDASPGSKKRQVRRRETKNFVVAYLNDETKNVMKDASQWSVDMFDLATASNGHPLQSVCFTVFIQNDIICDPFNIEANKLMKFMGKIEESYMDNPYHNSIHAADVLYGTHYMVNVLKFGGTFSNLEKFAIFFSAAVHDVGHVGVSNNFLVRSKNKLAITYNDSSVLEHMHASTAFEIGHSLNFFKPFSNEDYTEFRRLVIDMILATDLAQHMAFVAQLKTLNNKTTQFAVDEPMIFMKTIVKLCDVGHSLKDLPLHQKWTERIVEEFFRQGDREKEQGMPISPFMDRSKPDTPKNQVGFFEFIVLPFWQTSVKLAVELDPLLQVGLSNYNYWNDLKNKAKKEDTTNQEGKKIIELRGLLSFNEKAKKAKEANASNGVEVESLEIEVDKKINSYEEVG